MDQLWALAYRARFGRLSKDDASVIADKLPKQFAAFPDLDLPDKAKHPAGFSISGASVASFVRSALLLAGHKALGRRFGGHAFYEAVEKDVAFNVMRSNFHLGYPKGTHCCAQCSLAVLPVLEAGAIRWFDCAEHAASLRSAIDNGQWRFRTPPNAKMLAWAKGEPQRGGGE